MPAGRGRRRGSPANLAVNGKVILGFMATQAAAIPETTDEPTGRHLRIQEVADLVGLTPRSIRYYEEVGLLRPAARTQGAYRLYDASDIERLRFIKGLRDDAGFSLADIGRLLEDEGERRRAREAYEATDDPSVRRAILQARLGRIDEQVATIRPKIERLQAMVDDARGQRARLETLLAGLQDEG
jgi:DNA-binding transcriptional MerR regulator